MKYYLEYILLIDSPVGDLKSGNLVKINLLTRDNRSTLDFLF